MQASGHVEREARRGGAISSSIGAAADPTGLRFGCLSPSQKGHAPARVRRAHADPIVSAVDTLCGGTSRQVMKSPRPRTCTAPVHTARVSTAPRTADLPPTVPGHAALVSRLRRPAGRGDRPVADTDGRRDAGHTRVAACLHWDLAGVRRKVGRVACLLVDPSRSADVRVALLSLCTYLKLQLEQTVFWPLARSGGVRSTIITPRSRRGIARERSAVPCCTAAVLIEFGCRKNVHVSGLDPRPLKEFRKMHGSFSLEERREIESKTAHHPM